MRALLDGVGVEGNTKAFHTDDGVWVKLDATVSSNPPTAWDGVVFDKMRGCSLLSDILPHHGVLVTQYDWGGWLSSKKPNWSLVKLLEQKCSIGC